MFTRQLWEQLGADLFKAVQSFVFKKLQAKLKFNEKIKDEASRKIKMIRSRQDLNI